ncbi:HugZ family protein [Peteryoungia desertarenae]|uniref:HugZ family protein n=1 Tax=Peteryoungia desertarenae TaxID=1813451 RepID=A0ABX6QR21_9HYPH|nr:pyridoxamine 5'-phosphate oxidase family protein [Peteryoungia desertarenae]QLF71061.1 HugZ family protein [Peteryoungia desertarenae]
MPDKPSVLRETDEDARRQARILLRGARFASIGVIDPETGFPSVSRVLLGMDHDGVPVILVSALSGHTKALNADPRASLLTGEPGKGDPLAHPRLSLQCSAERVEPGSPIHQRIRSRFIERHAKAKLYVDFPDFCFFRLIPTQASLNGGFGRAYVLPGADFTIEPAEGDLWGNEEQVLLDLRYNNPDAASRLALLKFGAEARNWAFCGLDRAGIDLISGDLLLRFEFAKPVSNRSELTLELSNSEYAVP